MRSSLIALLVCAGGAAHAFDDSAQFFANTALPHIASVSASAEGVYFTGSPRWSSLDCSACHTDGPGKVTIKVGVDDQNLFDIGYVPGKTYQFEVELQNESEGTQFNQATCTEPPGPKDTYAYVPCNNNSFGLEFDDSTNAPVGTYCSKAPQGSGCPMPDELTDEVVVSPDGQAVFGNRQHSSSNPKTVSRNDPTHWNFWWTAPPKGTGPVTLYTAAVDGNGGSGMPTSDQDPYGDDTVRATISLQEQGAEIPTGAQAGCAVHRADPRALLPLGLLALTLLALRRRRRPL